MPAPGAAEHRDAFARAQEWRDWISSGDAEQELAWRQEHTSVALDDDERRVIAGFREPLLALCISGLWCSDSLRAGAALARIAEASTVVQLRFIDRERSGALMEAREVAGARRIPVTLLMSRAGEFVDAIGDRTLARYRMVASQRFGAGAPPTLEPVQSGQALTRAGVRELVERFERAHLLLALRPGAAFRA